MITVLQAREVAEPKFFSERIHIGRNLVLDGTVEDFYIQVENEVLELQDARALRDYFIDLVKAMEETYPKHPDKPLKKARGDQS